MSALDRAAVAERALIIVNLGCDPFAKFSQRGLQLTSQRTDALSYGGQWENLVLRLDSVVQNSWREVITAHHEGSDGLLDCLCDYLAHAPLDGAVALPLPRVYSFSSPRGASIARRVEGLFQDVIACYRPGAAARERARYVLRIGRDYYLLQPENNVPRAQRVGPEAQLLRALGAPQEGFSPVAFDPHLALDAPLPLLYQHNQPAVVQLFYQRIGAHCEIYLLDEHGALFHERHTEADVPALLGHYGRFLAAALRRRALVAGADPEPAIEVCEILTAQDRRLMLAPRPQTLETPARGYLELTVLAEPGPGNQPRFTLYCDGHEFSALEHGEGLFAAVARRIMALRASGACYPIYITDIELARSLTEHHGSGGVATTQLLHYKQRIEHSLNERLNAR
jgi:adenylate cyclase class 1